MSIKFDWDAKKAAANRVKHGISFETAARVFLDPFMIMERDLRSIDEDRWRTIGAVDGRLFLLGVHTREEEYGAGEYVRIISAREVNRKERRRYERENR